MVIIGILFTDVLLCDSLEGSAVGSALPWLRCTYCPNIGWVIYNNIITLTSSRGTKDYALTGTGRVRESETPCSGLCAVVLSANPSVWDEQYHMEIHMHMYV